MLIALSLSRITSLWGKDKGEPSRMSDLHEVLHENEQLGRKNIWHTGKLVGLIWTQTRIDTHQGDNFEKKQNIFRYQHKTLNFLVGGFKVKKFMEWRNNDISHTFSLVGAALQKFSWTLRKCVWERSESNAKWKQRRVPITESKGVKWEDLDGMRKDNWMGIWKNIEENRELWILYEFREDLNILQSTPKLICKINHFILRKVHFWKIFKKFFFLNPD